MEDMNNNIRSFYKQIMIQTLIIFIPSLYIVGYIIGLTSMSKYELYLPFVLLMLPVLVKGYISSRYKTLLWLSQVNKDEYIKLDLLQYVSMFIFIIIFVLIHNIPWNIIHVIVMMLFLYNKKRKYENFRTIEYHEIEVSRLNSIYKYKFWFYCFVLALTITSVIINQMKDLSYLYFYGLLGLFIIGGTILQFIRMRETAK